MIPEYAIRRTHAVKCGHDCGTAIVIDVNRRRFLVSAKHVFSSYENHKTVECLTSQGWVGLDHEFKVRGSSLDIIDDYIVFEIGGQLQEASELLLGRKGDAYIGQDIYALGYPMHLPSPLSQANSGFPPALARRGILSGLISSGGFDSLYVIDVFFNKGMSGGPILLRDLNDRSILRLIGIGVAFFSPLETINAGDNTATHNPNTGLAFCVPIERITSVLLLV